jgi:ABC-type transport system involved in cytochrome bd biosynthesis fused ATPase/permease subunit
MFERAFAKRARIYVFDEPTNHMDLDAVRAMLEKIQRIKSYAAILLVSHDPEVVALADTVIRIPAAQPLFCFAFASEI